MSPTKNCSKARKICLEPVSRKKGGTGPEMALNKEAKTDSASSQAQAKFYSK